MTGSVRTLRYFSCRLCRNRPTSGRGPRTGGVLAPATCRAGESRAQATQKKAGPKARRRSDDAAAYCDPVPPYCLVVSLELVVPDACDVPLEFPVPDCDVVELWLVVVLFCDVLGLALIEDWFDEAPLDWLCEPPAFAPRFADELLTFVSRFTLGFALNVTPPLAEDPLVPEPVEPMPALLPLVDDDVPDEVVPLNVAVPVPLEDELVLPDGAVEDLFTSSEPCDEVVPLSCTLPAAEPFNVPAALSERFTSTEVELLLDDGVLPWITVVDDDGAVSYVLLYEVPVPGLTYSVRDSCSAHAPSTAATAMIEIWRARNVMEDLLVLISVGVRVGHAVRSKGFRD